MVDVMRYPLSSSSSGRAVAGGLNERVPRIQSVGVESKTDSDERRPEDDPDNTLNFIEELKAMLKSTDQLINKPMALYDR